MLLFICGTMLTSCIYFLLQPAIYFAPFCIKNFSTLKCFLKSFIGLLESTSLWVVIPLKVRPLTSRSPQSPRKRDPHWELMLFLYTSLIFLLFTATKRNPDAYKLNGLKLVNLSYADNLVLKFMEGLHT